MAWIKAGSTTTTGNVGNIDVNSMTANKFNQILYHVIGNGGTAATEFRVSSDSGTNYASRESGNGGADGTHTNDTGLPQVQFGANTEFVVSYMCNISGEEKLFLKWTIDQGTAGAGNLVYRRELAGKHVTTSGQITDVEYYDTNSGTSIATDSNLSVIGSDGVAELNVQDGAIYYDTDLNKEYVLYNNTWTEV